MKILFLLILLLVPINSFALTIEAEVESFTEKIYYSYEKYDTREIIYLKSKEFIISMPMFSFVGEIIDFICPVGTICKIEFEAKENHACNYLELKDKESELPYYHKIQITSIQRIKGD